jgi:3-hydroxy-3-methylglutaryl CoA synthase
MSGMRGIVSAGAYIPHRRLDRAEIAATFGKGGGKGSRAVASYDEDTTTMAVEAARRALRADRDGVDALWFSTSEPAYLDKTNATAIHAALRLSATTVAADFGGAPRSAAAALRAALTGSATTLLCSAGLRSGPPTSADEAAGGDGGAATLVGGGDGVIAEYLGGASLTEEFLDRWRTPGEAHSKVWEERFGESVYVPLGEQAWKEGLEAAGVAAADVAHVAVVGSHARSVGRVARKLGVADDAVIDDLSRTVGNVGAAQLGLLLTALLEGAEPGQLVAVLALYDGADAFVFRATDAMAAWSSARPVADQAQAGEPVPYGTFLSWRGEVTVQPPNRPEPQRAAAPPAHRRSDWKFGLVGPPGAHDPAPLADLPGTIVTFTVDRLAYSPSPPIVFAVVDFDEDAGRLPVELTDVDADSLAIGDRVEMTFRRLTSADGVHNYFWKARPIR